VDRIAHLDDLLQKELPKLYRFLQRPAEERKISAAERKIGVELPDSLRALYAWKDGSSDLPFFGDFVFLSVSEIAKQHKALMAAFKKRAAVLHDAPWIPFLYDCNEQVLLCVDTAGFFGGAEGQIIAAGLWEEPLAIAYESVDAWLDILIAMLKGGMDLQRPPKEGPKKSAWERSFAAVRREERLRPPKRVDAYAETLRGQVNEVKSSKKEMLLEEGLEDKHGEMRRATLQIVRQGVVPPGDGAWIAFEMARELLRRADAHSAKQSQKNKQTNTRPKMSPGEAYEQALDVWEDVSDALITAALLDPSRKGAAVELFEQAIASATTVGERFYLRFQLGYFYDRTGDIEEAIASYRAAVELHGQMPARLRRMGTDYAHNNLGVLLEQSGRLDEAEAMYRSGIEVSPKDGIVHKGLADTLMRLGRREEALAEYRVAAKRSPSWLGVWTALCTCCQRLGLDAEAESALNKARKAANGEDIERVELACLLAVEGDADGALDLLRESIEADPSLRRAMRRDLDFEHLWGDPRFLELVS
jgi:Flp pilus assembly protein TadD/cell wall assembly regulator SMI1